MVWPLSHLETVKPLPEARQGRFYCNPGLSQVIGVRTQLQHESATVTKFLLSPFT